jgi:hypothetical protein
MELEALCKKYAEDAQKLRKEKATLEGMVESHVELIMDITNKIELNRMGEDAENEEDDQDEDDEDRGYTVAPVATLPSAVPVPPSAAQEVIVIKEEDPMEMVPKQEATVAHVVILADDG